jgi:PAS domain S-box-containing protein
MTFLSPEQLDRLRACTKDETAFGQVLALIQEISAPASASPSAADVADMSTDQAVFQGSLDAIPANVALLDKDGKIIAINKSWRAFGEANGYPDNSIGLGVNYFSVCDFVDGAAGELARNTAEGIRHVIDQTLESFVIDEYPCPTPQEMRWYKLWVTRFALKDQIHTLVAHEDITARKQREDLKRYSDYLHHLITLNMPDGMVFLFDPTLRCLVAEGAGLIDAGYSREMVIGKHLRDIFPEEIWQRDEPKLLAALAGEKAVNDVQLNDRFYRVQILPVYNEQQQIVGGMLLSQNITEYKRAQIAAEENETFFREVFDSAAVGIALGDARGGFIRINNYYQKLLGYTLEELRLLNFADLTHPEDLPRELALINELIAQKRSHYQLEKRYIRKDGSHVWVQLTGTALRNSEGDVRYGLAIVEDITERRRLAELALEQERLNIELRKERELSDLKNKMMIRIAHEFRTPLTVILLNSELIERFTDEKTQARFAKRFRQIESQVEHLTRILNDVQLIMKQPHSSGFDMEPTRFDLVGLCREMIEDLKISMDVEDRPIVLQADRDEILFEADPRLIRRLLDCLISNAMKFSYPDKNVRLDLSAGEGEIRLQVIDKGIGILPTDKPRIFEPFFRGTNFDETAGLGLGLSIAQEIVKLHHGAIQVDSKPGKGTTVTVRLPHPDKL